MMGFEFVIVQVVIFQRLPNPFYPKRFRLVVMEYHAK